jgi:(S)-citramalyl-CoA lyase
MFPKALRCGVDMVCVELEDGIAPKDKSSARDLSIALFEKDSGFEHVERILRINSVRTKFGLNDLNAVLSSDTPPPSLMLPKVMDAEEILIVDDLLTESGKECDLHPIIETNKGLENVFKIASSSKRIKTLFFGLIDMAAELRCKLSWEDLLYARSRVVHAAAKAGIDAIDGPYLDLQDEEGLEKYCEQARNLGFTGKGSINPKQVPIINKVFSPNKDEIAKAEKILKIFNEADTGLVMVDGKLIEKPVLRQMQRTIDISKNLNLDNKLD